MPKPGYYYYRNRSALRGIALLGVFAVGVYLAKSGPAPDADFLDHFSAHRVPIFIGALTLAIVLWAVQRVRRRFLEPRAEWFHSRGDFVAALEKYCDRKLYNRGWVWHRSRRYWPEDEE
jgi:hypothetical protein